MKCRWTFLTIFKHTKNVAFSTGFSHISVFMNHSGFCHEVCLCLCTRIIPNRTAFLLKQVKQLVMNFIEITV